MNVIGNSCTFYKKNMCLSLQSQVVFQIKVLLLLQFWTMAGNDTSSLS